MFGPRLLCNGCQGKSNFMHFKDHNRIVSKVCIELSGLLPHSQYGMANILDSAVCFSSFRTRVVMERIESVLTHLKMATCFVEYVFGQQIFFSTLYFSNQRLDGGTPIHLACRLGAPEILQCLYEHDPAAFQHALVDKEVMTPLHRSVKIVYSRRKSACFLICFSLPAKSIFKDAQMYIKVLFSVAAARERLNPAFIGFDQ